MSTELERQLRDALHEDAQRARLLNPDGPPPPVEWELDVDVPRRTSPRRIVAVAAAVALIAGVTVAILRDDEDAPDVDMVPLIVDDLEPGATMALPPGPLSPRSRPVLVWTGTEMIAWGGSDAAGTSLGDGAAFDLQRGTWRTIAPAPIEPRTFAHAVWTGSEVLVVGGFRANGPTGSLEFFRDGAAYDPASDSWRRLPEAPIGFADDLSPVWTGEELVVVAEGAAAYRPETNSWRDLTDPPVGFPETLVWAGEAVVMINGSSAPGTGEEATSLARYDLEADEWEVVEDQAYASLVVVPDGDGEPHQVLALPVERGFSVHVLDRAGRFFDVLVSNDAEEDEGIYGQLLEPGVGATWLGQEALFWIRTLDSPYRGLQLPAPFAVEPETGRWRSLGASAPPADAQYALAPEAGVLLGWGSLSTDAQPAAFAYRPPGLDDRVEPLEDRLGMPVPGEQPADPVGAEEEVRAAFVAFMDASRPIEERAALVDRPEVWVPAYEEMLAGQYGDLVRDIRAEVDDVVFTTPTDAAVRYRQLASSDLVPSGYVIGFAVFVDGRWVVNVETPCERISITGVQCDLSAEPTG